jgi:DNA (cytosine-5)-methyltransferase 1
MTAAKLKVLDLFSGIGGFSLGLERTGGFETVAFCEIEPFCRRVLAKHWPDVRQYEDVRTLTADTLRRDGIAVDVITGGFPCQDISIAGKQAGMGEGTRSGLWSEVARLTRDLRPSFIIMENVANLLRGPDEQPGGWFGRVLGDLAELGYDAEWENIPASALGAPHRRERVWLVAYSNEIRRDRSPLGLPALRQFVSRVAEGIWISEPPEPIVLGVDDRIPNGVDQRAAYGNTVVPQIPELIGRAILEARAAA